jgi:Zn-dependent peptidase ImmA (M78 family)
MPTSSLLRQFNEMCQSQGKFTPTTLFTLAHYYGVSVQALVLRLEDMKLLPSGTWDRLRDSPSGDSFASRGLKVRQVQQELGLEEIAHRADMVPVHYQHLAIEALDQGIISEGKFAKLLGLNRLEARDIANKLREYSSGITEETTHLDLREA